MRRVAAVVRTNRSIRRVNHRPRRERSSVHVVVVVNVAHKSHWLSFYRRRQPVFGCHVVDDDQSLHIPQQESRDLFGVDQ